MAQVQELKAEVREGKGKGPAYQARAKGLIPGIVYGGKDQPQPVSVDFRTLERHVEAGSFLTTLFMLDVGGTKTRVIPRDVQLDPVSDRPVHVDFMRLAEGSSVRLEIPVHFTATQTGKFEIVCTQLCGLGHYKMHGMLKVVSQADFDKWISAREADKQ